MRRTQMKHLGTTCRKHNNTCLSSSHEQLEPTHNVICADLWSARQAMTILIQKGARTSKRLCANSKTQEEKEVAPPASGKNEKEYVQVSKLLQITLPCLKPCQQKSTRASSKDKCLWLWSCFPPRKSLLFQFLSISHSLANRRWQHLQQLLLQQSLQQNPSHFHLDRTSYHNIAVAWSLLMFFDNRWCFSCLYLKPSKKKPNVCSSAEALKNLAANWQIGADLDLKLGH